MNRIVRKEKKLVIVFLVLSFIASTIEISFAPIIQSFIDAITNKDFGVFTLSIWLFFLFIVFNFFFHYMASILEATILKKVHLTSKNQVMENLLGLKPSEFGKSTMGEKINIFEYDLEVYEHYYLENLFLVVQNIFVIVIAFAYLLSVSVLVTGVILLCAVLSFIIPSLAGRKIDSLTENNSKLKSTYLNELKEIFGGYEVIKSFRVEKNFNAKHLTALTDLETNSQMLKIQNTRFNLIIGSTQYLILIICFCVSGYLVIQGRLSLGQMVAITQITNMVIQPLQLLGGAIVEIAGSKTVRENLERYVQKHPNDVKSDDITTNDFCSLELKDVSYSVNETHYILQTIDLLFEKGKKYAIVGHSGSGKTTLLNIIGQLLDDYSGSILYNGKDVKSEHYIKYDVAFVHQDTFIFSETLEKNITLLQNYSDATIEYAISFSELEEKSKKLGNTIVKEKGVELSGGEKQRIAIARSVVRNAPIVLMDEVTSALDYKTGKEITEKLLLDHEKTLIFVTHDLRKSFLHSMDQIICVKDGRVIESGTYIDLYNKQGFFYELSHSI